LLLRWSGRGDARTAKRKAERRLGAANGPSITFRRCSVLQRQAPLDRVRSMRAITAQQALRAQTLSDLGRHPVSGVALVLGRVPEEMRHEFQRERLVAGHDSGWPAAAFAQASK
jgi:hypothetical protein